jgi:hypothetical protein
MTDRASPHPIIINGANWTTPVKHDTLATGFHNPEKVFAQHFPVPRSELFAVSTRADLDVLESVTIVVRNAIIIIHEARKLDKVELRTNDRRL